MNILVLQIIIKQWDKSERSDQHVKNRAKIPTHYCIDFPNAFYALNNQCIIDPHGDDILGKRINYSQLNNGKISLDRFQVCLNSKLIEYTNKTESSKSPNIIASLDNSWVKYNYSWRYSVYEGGFYYWLYEAVTLNAIIVDTLNPTVFLDLAPSHVYDDLN